MSSKNFNVDLQLFAKTLDVNISTVTQVVTTKIFNAVTLRTPVDTGRARAGWGISIGTPSVATPPPGQYNQPPQAPDVSAIDGTQPVFVLNNVEYIERLEDGWSKQAPAGMVVLSLMEVQNEIEAELRSRGVGT